MENESDSYFSFRMHSVVSLSFPFVLNINYILVNYVDVETFKIVAGVVVDCLVERIE